MEIPCALAERLRRRADSRLGRLLVLTGARQTGKTTLARAVFPDFEYISLEDPVLRPGQILLLDRVKRHVRRFADATLAVPAAWALGSPAEPGE